MEHSVILQLRNITKTYARQAREDKILVLDDVSLALEQGDLLGLLGPSGCGKTTLLRIIAGFESISQGTVEIAGKTVCDNCDFIPAERRNTGMVFQDYALFPHLTVEENIAFGLHNQVKKLKKKMIFFKQQSSSSTKQRVNEVLELVGLSSLSKRYPHQLSGGQQQRISLARALAPQPSLILLDEPLSNLDVQVRHRLRSEIRAILKAAGTSAIFVTHDREEAMAISDKIAVMRRGKIEQVATPEETYLNPQSRFVAEFVTQANFIPAQRSNRHWVTELGKVRAAGSLAEVSNEKGDLMLRQEDIILTPDVDSDMTIVERQFLGREYYYSIETQSGKRIQARTGLDNAIAIGTKVKLSLDIDSPKIFFDRDLSKKPLSKIKV
ncbi:MAG: ABC transporter ATP-binding protein [Cyanobacteria bacterium P01_G01_bin.19]